MSRWIDSTFGVALGASLLLHGGGISGPIVYEWVTGRPASLFQIQPKIPLPPKVSFEFVDSPDQASETDQAKETNRISDKETLARDNKPDKPENLNEGPDASVRGESFQLSKRNYETMVIRQKKGKLIKKEEYLTPLQQLEESEPVSRTLKKEIESVLDQLDMKLPEEIKKELVEEFDKDLEKKELLEAQREKVKKKREQETAQNLTPQGNADENRKILQINPSGNVDTYSSEKVQEFLSTAVNVGEISFNAKKHILGPYLKKLKSRIAPLWKLKLESESFGNFLTTKKVVIGMKILPDGRLESLLILKDYGDDLFNKVCLDTVAEASPFDTVPSEWLTQSGLNYLNLIYTFTIY